MSALQHDTDVDVTALQNHLQEALDSAEDERAKYHLREACQKAVILDEH